MKTQEDDLLVYDEGDAVKFILNFLPEDAKKASTIRKLNMYWMWFMSFTTKMA